jgi:hypothetical protein
MPAGTAFAAARALFDQAVSKHAVEKCSSLCLASILFRRVPQSGRKMLEMPSGPKPIREIDLSPRAAGSRVGRAGFLVLASKKTERRFFF